MFVPASLRVRSGTASGRQRSLGCYIAPTLIEGLLEDEPTWNDARLAEALALSDPATEWILLRIYQELRQPGFATQVMLESLASALGVAIIRKFSLHCDQPEDSRTGGLAPWRLRSIRDRAYADGPAPKLGELAQLCDISVRHLTRAFKAETGETIASFVQQATIARAQAMLHEGILSSSEISHKLGFASATSFCSAYRRATGHRPGDFKSSWRT